ncbi:MAG TPA: histidinol dehydrogenase [Vicinamibacterales bacterium]|nr:histidinol dehydrogenase [Vicinamibacterales bacterium]
MIPIVDAGDARAAELLSATRVRDVATERRAAKIIEAVRTHRDRALRRYATELDGLVGPLEVPRSEWQTAARTLPRTVRTALKRAALHIRRVARAQMPHASRTTLTAGVIVEQRVIPLDRVGCYVPGGLYPLPSSLLMTAIPARVAGVKEVVAVSPRPHPAVLAAALEAGIDRFFQIGGAHAVAALAYGTRTVPRVDKIVGPGNRWVAAAKTLVSSVCSIDFYAGPTEIVIVAARGRADWIAADLAAQAEHDPDARAVLITPSRQLARDVLRHVERLTPADGPARLSLTNHGGIIVTRNLTEAMQLANDAAPEHLVVETEALARNVRCAGAVFVGPWTAQVAGDYAIGSNHVLPTAGAARFRGGLNATDFVRLVSVQRLTRRGLARIAPTITALARAEGLDAHARSIDIRIHQGTVEPKPQARRRKLSAESRERQALKAARREPRAPRVES